MNGFREQKAPSVSMERVNIHEQFPASEFEEWFIQKEVDRYRILVS